MQIITPADIERQELNAHLGRFDDVTSDAAEAFFTGYEHGINWQTYASDDEPVFDCEPELDRLAYEEWRDTEAVYDELIEYAGHPVKQSGIVW